MAEYDVKKVQEIELEILKEFDRVCKKYNLSYFLDSGTALGAVRHKGFIPWDDDIDVGMMREDYDIFITRAYKDLKSNYFLQTLQSDPKCPCLFAKIRKNGTIYQENNKKNLKMHNGIWIDIFPYDYISSDVNEQKKIGRRMKNLVNFFYVKKIPHKYINIDQNKVRYFISAAIRKLLHWGMKLIPDSYFVNHINKLIDNNKSRKDCVACYFYIMYNGDDKPMLIYDTKKIIPTSTNTFDGNIFPVVNDEDYYLSILYGNYMELPPIEKRVGHIPLYVDYGK